MSLRPVSPVVAIVGGGFTGAAVALHLARRLAASTPARIVVYEPRATLGSGLAYSTTEPANRINVPAGKMALDPDDPTGFERFLAETGALLPDREAVTAEGLAYPRRAAFGAYVGSVLAPFLAAGVILHDRRKVTGVTRLPGGFLLQASGGEALLADILVIATSHPPPALPAVLRPLAGHPKLIADLNAAESLAAVAPGDRVLVVGNGLTAADAVAALARRGHHGPILSVSRRGLRSRGHAPLPQEPLGDFVTRPERSAARLVARVRRTLRTAEGQGQSWHAVFDALRVQGQEIWQALPVAERRRIARHIRPYWDVHRFRIAPQVEKVLDDAMAEGRLEIAAASLVSAAADDHGFQIGLRPRRGAEVRSVEVDVVINTTGPAHGGILGSQPFISQLQSVGLLTLCPTGLGLACNLSSRAISASGAPVETLLIAGPLARGTFGELMGLPQVADHALSVASEIAALLARRTDAPDKTPPGGGRNNHSRRSENLEKITL